MKIIEYNNKKYIEHETYKEAQNFEKNYTNNWLESCSIYNESFNNYDEKELEIAYVLRGYMGNQHKLINGILRKNLVNNNLSKYNDYLFPLISVIKKEMSKFTLTENLITYRLVDEDRLMRNKHKNSSIFNHIKKGFQWKDTGFVSTGIVLDEVFGKQYISGDVLLKIYVDKGINALYLDKLKYNKECELLLDRNLTFTIKKIEKMIDRNNENTEKKKYLKLCTVTVEKED